MNIDTMPLALIEVPIEVKICESGAVLHIDHTNLFRERTKVQISEFAALADVLGKLSRDGCANIVGSAILEWRFGLDEFEHVRFVIDKYADCARWYKVVWK